MVLLVIFFGILFFVAAYEDNVPSLTGDLQRDIPGFGKWAVAIIVLWSLGLWKPARVPADAMMFLLLTVIIVAQGSGISSFLNNVQHIGSTVQPIAPSSGTTTAAPAEPSWTVPAATTAPM